VRRWFSGEASMPDFAAVPDGDRGLIAAPWTRASLSLCSARKRFHRSSAHAHMEVSSGTQGRTGLGERPEITRWATRQGAEGQKGSLARPGFERRETKSDLVLDHCYDHHV
jgi:hypothetical protein